MAKKRNKKSGLAGEIGKKGAFANLQQETQLNLMRTHTLLSSEFTQQLFRPLGLSHEKYNVLRILAGENRPMQIYEVAEGMIAPKTDISRLIERLVATELISRERCNEDGRVVWVKLTAKGTSVLKKLAKPVDDLHASQFGSLSRKELETLNRLLFKARGKQEE
jgi:DNA-binding MarR family transcriptional regulator